MVFNTGAALLDAIVLAVVSRESQGTYGYKITQDVRQVLEAVSYTHLDVYKRQDLGNIFHSAMEQFSKKLEEHQVTWTTVSEELREQLIEESVEAGVTNYGNAVLYSSSRNEYVITRMKRLLRRTVWALTKQLEKGDFVPAGYEISFGNLAHLESVNLSLSEHARMRLRGKIDRVDLYEDEEHVYVKVIDYKTGAKAFQLGEMYHGLQLQLIVYLNAVMEMEEQKHPEKEIVPAGIFYYQMRCV